MFRAQLVAMEKNILELLKGRWAFSLEETPRMHVIQGYRIFSK